MRVNISISAKSKDISKYKADMKIPKVMDVNSFKVKLTSQIDRNLKARGRNPDAAIEKANAIVKALTPYIMSTEFNSDSNHQKPETHEKIAEFIMTKMNGAIDHANLSQYVDLVRKLIKQVSGHNDSIFN